MSFTLKVITPEKEVYKGEADSITAPGMDGLFGVFKDHAPMVSGLGLGILSVKNNYSEELISLSSGFLEVSDNVVSVMADTAEKGSVVDVERAQEAKKRAEERLQKQENIDRTRAEISLSRALNRLKASGN